MFGVSVPNAGANCRPSVCQLPLTPGNWGDFCLSKTGLITGYWWLAVREWARLSIIFVGHLLPCQSSSSLSPPSSGPMLCTGSLHAPWQMPTWASCTLKQCVHSNFRRRAVMPCYASAFQVQSLRTQVTFNCGLPFGKPGACSENMVTFYRHGANIRYCMTGGHRMVHLAN